MLMQRNGLILSNSMLYTTYGMLMPRSVLMLSNDIRVKVSHRINYALHSHVNFKDKMDWATGERECG